MKLVSFENPRYTLSFNFTIRLYMFFRSDDHSVVYCLNTAFFYLILGLKKLTLKHKMHGEVRVGARDPRIIK